MKAALPRTERPLPARSRRGRRRARLRFHFGRALFVLPNLFTIASVFCGFYAIVEATGPSSPAAMHRASVAICFAIFFDMADGRVARLTATESAFGVQLDSLADIVSFGVAPAVLVYRSSLARGGLIGLLLGFGYVACGAIRLARFNTLAAETSQKQAAVAKEGAEVQASYFLGLPIPLAAGQIATAVMCSQRYAHSWPLGRTASSVLVVALSALMASTVRYRTFKELRPTKGVLALAALVFAGFVSLAYRLSPAFGGLCLFGAYVLSGLVELAVRQVRAPRGGRSGSPPGA